MNSFHNLVHMFQNFSTHSFSNKPLCSMQSQHDVSIQTKVWCTLQQFFPWVFSFSLSNSQSYVLIKCFFFFLFFQNKKYPLHLVLIHHMYKHLLTYLIPNDNTNAIVVSNKEMVFSLSALLSLQHFYMFSLQQAILKSLLQ